MVMRHAVARDPIFNHVGFLNAHVSDPYRNAAAAAGIRTHAFELSGARGA